VHSFLSMPARIKTL